MSEAAENDNKNIRIISILKPEKVFSGNPAAFLEITFQVDKEGPYFPVTIMRKQVSDENIIKVARHYLHMQAQRLAEQTASWKLTDEEYKAIAPQ